MYTSAQKSKDLTRLDFLPQVRPTLSEDILANGIQRRSMAYEQNGKSASVVPHQAHPSDRGRSEKALAPRLADDLFTVAAVVLGGVPGGKSDLRTLSLIP